MKIKGNSKEGIFAGIGWSYAERLISQTISLLVSIILARLLTPDDYGIIAIVIVFINIGDALVNGGLGTALVHKKEPTELDFNSICWLSLAVSAAMYGILFFTAPIIADFYETDILVPIIRVMGIKFIFITSDKRYSMSYLVKDRKKIKKQFLAFIESHNIKIVKRYSRR